MELEDSHDLIPWGSYQLNFFSGLNFFKHVLSNLYDVMKVIVICLLLPPLKVIDVVRKN